MEHSITINGRKLAFDIFELENAKRYEAAMGRIGTKIKKIQEEEATLSFSDNIRRQCNAVIACMDEIFGEGSAQLVLGEETNLRSCLAAFGEVAAGINSQKLEMDQLARDIGKNLTPTAFGHEAAAR